MLTRYRSLEKTKELEKERLRFAKDHNIILPPLDLPTPPYRPHELKDLRNSILENQSFFGDLLFAPPDNPIEPIIKSPFAAHTKKEINLLKGQSLEEYSKFIILNKFQTMNLARHTWQTYDNEASWKCTTSLVQKCLGEKYKNTEGTYSHTSLFSRSLKGTKIVHGVHALTAPVIMHDLALHAGCGARDGKDPTHGTLYYRNTLTDAHFVRYFFFDLDNSQYNTLTKIKHRLEKLGLFAFTIQIIATSTNRFHVYISAENYIISGLRNPHFTRRSGVYSKGGASNTALLEAYSDNVSQMAWYRYIWETINTALQGDPACGNFLRMAATPGFFNPKTGFMAKLVYFNPDAALFTIKAAAPICFSIAKAAKPVAPKETKAIPNPMGTKKAAPVKEPTKTKARLRAMPKSWEQLIQKHKLPVPKPGPIYGQRNAIFLALCRPLAYYVPTPSSPEAEVYWNTIIRPYFLDSTSRDLNEERNCLDGRMYKNYQYLLNKNCGSAFTKRRTFTDEACLKEIDAIKTDIVASVRDYLTGQPVSTSKLLNTTYMDSTLNWLAPTIDIIAEVATFARGDASRNGYLETTTARQYFFFIPVEELKKPGEGFGRYIQKIRFLEDAGIISRSIAYTIPDPEKKIDGRCKEWSLTLQNRVSPKGIPSNVTPINPWVKPLQTSTPVASFLEANNPHSIWAHASDPLKSTLSLVGLTSPSIPAGNLTLNLHSNPIRGGVEFLNTLNPSGQVPHLNQSPITTVQPMKQMQAQGGTLIGGTKYIPPSFQSVIPFPTPQPPILDNQLTSQCNVHFSSIFNKNRGPPD